MAAAVAVPAARSEPRSQVEGPQRPVDASSTAEWLETDGLGGFASGVVNGVRSRRYHALLLAATTPPTGRYVLVNGFDAWVETSGGRFSNT